MELDKKNNPLEINIGGLKLDNPIIPASGTFGFGYEFAEIYDINCLGSISLKGTTKEERYGNPTPRIAEASSGLLNAVGLQNPGIDRVISEELLKLKEVFNKKAIANISGFSIEEYVEVASKFDECEQIGILEINISCPNVKHGGLSFGTSAEMAARVTHEVKKAVKKPVFIKLSPNVTSIADIAKACEVAGADGISMINTLMGMRIDIKTGKPVIKNVTGGLSGPAVFPVALRMIYDVYKSVKIPIIGMGGISSADDVIEMMMAGATAVQIGAMNLIKPTICKDIIRKLPKRMEMLGIKSLSEIIGKAHI